jgi:hypothetical protein
MSRGTRISMKSVHVEIPKVTLIFHLFDDEVDDSMAKKLQKLGLPDIWLSYPDDSSDTFEHIQGNLYKQGDFSCSSIPVSEATDTASWSATFDSNTNTVSVSIEGNFLCFNDVYGDSAKVAEQQKFGYINAIKLNDTKGKPIKKPKNSYGISAPIEALIEKNSNDSASAQVSIKVTVQDID